MSAPRLFEAPKKPTNPEPKAEAKPREKKLIKYEPIKEEKSVWQRVFK